MPEKKYHILLVEDSHAGLLIATTLLEEFGYDYTVAGNGHEVLSLVQEKAFDLALMDIEMPGMNGFEVTSAIRAWEKETGRQRLPIVGITAHAMAGDRERCLAAGMDDYLGKPFYPNDFKSKLEAGLRLKK